MERTDANAFAGILLAIFYWEKDLVTMDEVKHSSDAINHTVLSEEKLQQAVQFLVRHGLIKDLGQGFSISGAGQRILESAEEGSSNIFDIWKALEPRIASLGGA
jgi:hypothetical protein